MKFIKADFKVILDTIEGNLTGEAHLDELTRNKEDPFKILISTILSARTKDVNTREATKKLFSQYNTPQDIANAPISKLEELIYKAGFYKVKARRIKEVAQIIQNEYLGKVPEKREHLISLPGVGSKTANCVLVYAFKKPAIPVDTHVHRISNRLGWVETKTPEKTEKRLLEILPKELWIRINRLFVRFGQEICTPNNPKCNTCPLNDICPRDFSMEIALKEKRQQKN